MPDHEILLEFFALPERPLTEVFTMSKLAICAL